MTDRAHDLTAGDRVGHFRVLAELGRGGMGSVYLAEDETLERRIALKVILPEFSHDKDFRKRFEREARSAAAIDHPNVVPVYAAGMLDARLFLVMRYIEGADLERRLSRAPNGKLEIEPALRVLGAVAAALDAAHEQGLVHRDIKPGNILIEGGNAGDAIYLTDFGLTKPWGAKGETQSGLWLGTPDYAAPEQMKSGWVDARTDVYSLGCVLYRMLSGEVPHRAVGPSKVLSIVDKPIPRIPGIGAALNDVIQQATAKAPEDRFPSAGDLSRAAASAAAGGDIPSSSSRSVAVGAASSGMAEAEFSEAATMRGIALQTEATFRLPTDRETSSARGKALLAAAAIAIVVAGVAAGAMLSASSSGDPETMVTTINSTVTTEVESRTSESEPQSASAPSPSSLDAFEGVGYGLSVPSGWFHDEVDEFSSEGGFYTNIWREPRDPESTYVRVDGGNAEPAADPISASEGLVNQLREASVPRVLLRPRASGRAGNGSLGIQH